MKLMSYIPARTLPCLLSRRHFLGGAAALSAATLLSGCAATLLPAAAATAIPKAVTNPQPIPDGSISSAAVIISAATSGSIEPGFAGLSYEKSSLCEPLFTASNSGLIALFRRLGPSVLRIGGNSVDQSVWTENGLGGTAGQIAPSDVASLAAFVKAAGWQCIYGVNLGGASTGATTPELAAAEVAYAAEQFGSSLIGIEIGNECDGYGATGSYFAGAWSLPAFQALWNEFRSAILGQTPGVSITGPASGSNVATWTVPFGQSVTSSDISQLSQHYYRGSGTASTASAANLVSPDANLVKCLSMLEAGAGSIGIPYRISECNSYSGGGCPGVSDSPASALWSLDFLFSCAQGGASGVNFHGGAQNSYAPITDKSGSVLGVYPEYYGMLLFTLAGQGALYQTQVSAGGLNVTAYAVKKQAGGMSVVVVNKDTTQSLQLTMSLPQEANTATLVALTQLPAPNAADSVTATPSISIQDGTVDTSGNFNPSAAYNLVASGPQLTCYVPAFSAILVQIA
jgi:hypothetical protein